MAGKRPRVTLHFAQSLDGRIAFAGQRTPLSSDAGVALAQRARVDHDAVMVGRTTVVIDNPRLTVPGSPDGPRRIVLASTMDIPGDAHVLNGGPATLVIGVEGRAAAGAVARMAAAGAETRLVPAASDGLVSLPHALAAIVDWGVRSLLVEGGAHVLSSFLRHRLADHVTIEIVPRLLGAPALASIGEIGVTTLEGCVDMDDVRVERADGSIVVRGRLAY